MFQFRAFPSYDYLIHRTILEYCSSVLPHSEISGSTLICSSPKLIAACHVLHRLLMPRHSPCALISFTSSKNPALRSTRLATDFLCARSFALVLLNYAGFNRSSYSKLYLPFLKVSTIALLKCDPFESRPLLPCFLLSLCSVFKVQLRMMYPQN